MTSFPLHSQARKTSSQQTTIEAFKRYVPRTYEAALSPGSHILCMLPASSNMLSALDYAVWF